jgi:hypothetical protein
MRPHPSGDRGPMSVLLRERLPNNRSDAVTQRVGDPFTPALAGFGDRVDCGHGRWDENREEDDKEDYGDREHCVLSFLRKADRLISSSYSWEIRRKFARRAEFG